MAFRFLDLPPELRDAVYSEVLNPDSFRRPLTDGYTRYDFDLSLFYVNRQVYTEARKIFFKNFLFVRVETPWDEAQHHVQTEGHVPVFTSGYLADNFHDHVLSLAIEAPTTTTLDRDSRKFLVLADDLDTFCLMWFYSDLSYAGELNAHLRMTLKLHNPFAKDTSKELPFALQKKLLLPFGKVKKLREINVHGSYSEKLYNAMRDEMNIPQDSAEKCLEDATKLKEAGNEMLRKGHPEKAVNLYIDSFRAIHIVCIGQYRGIWGDAWFDRMLHGGTFDGQHGQIVRLTLRVRLVANIVKAYLDMHNYVDAEYWGNRTIGLIRLASGTGEDEPLLNFPAAPELGKIYYRTGVANKMLGKMYEARKLFRVAYEYLPRNEQVRRELASVSPMLG